MAGAPRFASESPEGVAGTLWDVLGPWVLGQGIELRPWQELVARRAFEVDGDGRLVWRTVVVSTPRQSGKSWLIKAVAMARAAHPDLFGEPQSVVHVANKHLAARRIHSLGWGWAKDNGLDVRTAQGMERIIWPDGSSWDALTLTNVYGSSAGLVLLDEVWDVSPEDYREGLRPTQVERQMPQLWALSTAHRRASGLMGELFAQAAAGAGRVLALDWGCPPGVDPADESRWQLWLPHFSDQRVEEMRLMVGTDGFGEQWANVWPESDDGLRWVPRRFTDASRLAERLTPPADAWVGVESRWSADEEQPGRWAAAFVWDLGGQLVGVVERFDRLDELVVAAGDRRVVCHPSVAEQMRAMGRLSRVEGINVTRSRAASDVLAKALRGSQVRVFGVSDAVWAGLRTKAADGGQVIDARTSLSDVSAVKALSWAVWHVEEARHAGPILVA